MDDAMDEAMDDAMASDGQVETADELPRAMFQRPSSKTMATAASAKGTKS